MRSSNTVWLWVLIALCSSCSKREAAPIPIPIASPLPNAASPSPTPPREAEVTTSGLATLVLKAGEGDAHPTLQDKVRVQFSAWNTSGKLVDGSEPRGGPVTFAVDGVIKGWQEALQAMRVGEKRRLWVPDHLAYPGRPGYPRPPALFEIELLEIIKGVAPEPAPQDLAAAPKDAIETSSGLVYKVLEHDAARDNERPNTWDHVTLRYAGWTSDGSMFRSSRRQPEQFDLAKVIPGWRELLPKLSVGDKARLWVPEALAYRGRVGEPRGSLVYELELLTIERRPEPPRAPAELSAPPAKAARTPSGLAYRFLHRSGGSRRPGPHDRVSLHYSAWTRDGTLFDSSVVTGKPRSVPLDHLISGWSEGLQLMAEGDKAQLWIPERLAYQGRDGSPRGDLVYEVELLQLSAAP